MTRAQLTSLLGALEAHARKVGVPDSDRDLNDLQGFLLARRVLRDVEAREQTFRPYRGDTASFEPDPPEILEDLDAWLH